MQLTNVQKQHFIEYGFVQISGVVPRVMVDAAVRAINHSVGEGIDPAQLTKFRSQSYCPEVSGTPAITGLLNDTPLFSMCESLIGEGTLKRAGGGQIALRFPGLQDPPRPPGGHLDGMYSPHNGVKEGTIGNFTALVGVLLSDLPEENAANFTVWPGTHRLFEKYFQQHGPESLLNGMPKVEMPEPRQITGRAGDAVICHYQLAHGIAPNVSPHVRYATFFRLKHRDHDTHPMEVMTDIWKDWAGLREAVGRTQEADGSRQKAASAQRKAAKPPRKKSPFVLPTASCRLPPFFLCLASPPSPTRRARLFCGRAIWAKKTAS